VRTVTRRRPRTLPARSEIGYLSRNEGSRVPATALVADATACPQLLEMLPLRAVQAIDGATGAVSGITYEFQTGLCYGPTPGLRARPPWSSSTLEWTARSMRTTYFRRRCRRLLADLSVRAGFLFLAITLSNSCAEDCSRQGSAVVGEVATRAAEEIQYPRVRLTIDRVPYFLRAGDRRIEVEVGLGLSMREVEPLVALPKDFEDHHGPLSISSAGANHVFVAAPNVAQE